MRIVFYISLYNRTTHTAYKEGQRSQLIIYFLAQKNLQTCLTKEKKKEKKNLQRESAKKNHPLKKAKKKYSLKYISRLEVQSGYKNSFSPIKKNKNYNTLFYNFFSSKISYNFYIL